MKDSGTFHLCEKFQSYDSNYAVYKSLCGQHKERLHESEKPIKVRGKGDIPSTRDHDRCKTCMKRFEESWLDTMVNIPVPKIIAVKLKAAHENDTGLSRGEVEDIGELIDNHVSDLHFD